MNIHSFDSYIYFIIKYNLQMIPDLSIYITNFSLELFINYFNFNMANILRVKFVHSATMTEYLVLC